MNRMDKFCADLCWTCRWWYCDKKCDGCENFNTITGKCKCAEHCTEKFCDRYERR